MKLVIGQNALVIIPETVADVQQLEAFGFRDGGDWMRLVRQDIPGKSRMSHLQAGGTFKVDPREISVHEQQDVDRNEYPAPRNARRERGPNDNADIKQAVLDGVAAVQADFKARGG